MKHTDAFIYSLLPQFIKRNDADAGHVLRRLLSVVQEELDGVEHQIDALYDSWFIETCPEARLPAIAALIGIELDHVMPPLPSHRRLIANALSYRREKGTIAGLQSVLADASGWTIDVIEESESLAMTPSLRTIDTPSRADVNLHQGIATEDAARTVDLRASTHHDSDDAGTLRRLVVNVDRRVRAPITHGEMARVGTGRYTVSPLRINTPLFQRPAEESLSSRSDGHLLTNHLLASDLHDTLAPLRTMAGPAPSETRFWGTDRSVCLWLHERPLLPTQVRVDSLATWVQPGPFTAALMGEPGRPVTASQPELEFSLSGARRRTLKLDRVPSGMREAAELLQRALRKGVKDPRTRGCRVVVASDRLVVALDGHHTEVPFEFGPTPDDSTTCAELGLCGDDVAEALILVSAEVELRGHAGQPLSGHVHRDDASSIPFQCRVGATVAETAAQLQDTLRETGEWTVMAHADRLVIVPPTDGRAHKPWRLQADTTSQLTLDALGLDITVCIDAELGRVALPIGMRGRVYADWISGFDSAIGATPMARPLAGPTDSDWCVRVGRHYSPGGAQPGCYASVEAAIKAWSLVDRNGYIRIEDNGLYGQGRGPLFVDLRGRTLRIEAEASGHPCIARTVRVQGDNGNLSLSGISISGGLSVAGNLTMDLHHCTVANAISAERAGEFQVRLKHSMSAAIMLPDQLCTLSLTDSIVNGHGEPAVSGLDPEFGVGPSVTLERVTLHGDLRVQSIQRGLDSLINGQVVVEDTQTGLLDHCAFHDGSRVPRTVAERIIRTPATADDTHATRFDLHSTVVGQPGYMRAAHTTPNPFEAAASNGGELGAYNALFDNRRMHMMRRMLSEFLPLGWTSRVQISQ